jgi:hypothetical protein
LSVPSFLAAVTRAFIPPKALAEAAVAADVVVPPPEPLLLDELLPHPAAKTRLPIAAVPAIAYLPRKIPSHAQAFGGRKPSILARSGHIMARQVDRKVANRWTHRGWPVSARWPARTDLARPSGYGGAAPGAPPDVAGAGAGWHQQPDL